MIEHYKGILEYAEIANTTRQSINEGAIASDRLIKVSEVLNAKYAKLSDESQQEGGNCYAVALGQYIESLGGKPEYWSYVAKENPCICSFIKLDKKIYCQADRYGLSGSKDDVLENLEVFWDEEDGGKATWKKTDAKYIIANCDSTRAAKLTADILKAMQSIKESVSYSRRMNEASDPDKEFLALAKPKVKELEAQFTKEIIAIEKKYTDTDELAAWLLDMDGYTDIETKVLKAVFGAQSKKMIKFLEEDSYTPFGLWIGKLVDKLVRKVSKHIDAWETGDE